MEIISIRKISIQFFCFQAVVLFTASREGIMLVRSVIQITFFCDQAPSSAEVHSPNFELSITDTFSGAYQFKFVMEYRKIRYTVGMRKTIKVHLTKTTILNPFTQKRNLIFHHV